ncbi:PR-1-like protein, partial [Caulochytrium protostelioides]
HNYYRLKGGVPLLTWDHNQYVKACQRAEENLALGGIILSHGDNTGENLWAGDAKNAPEDITCANAVINAWYPEIKDYRPGTKIPMSESEDPVAFKLFEAYGHYTQLVWPTSTKFGCCTRGNKIACTYDPAGNIAGR